MNLLTLADGFGDSMAVPHWYPDYIKWPEIIKLMTRGVNLLNLSRYGAGNEYIIQCLRHNLHQQDAVLIQWAVPDRLDLILSHNTAWQSFWQEQIVQDPVYYNNVVNLGSDKIWISSASMLPAVQEYHQKYIGLRQHQVRSQLFIEHATILLQNIKYGFLLTKNSEYLESSVVNHEHWYWHNLFKGMCEFRKISQYAELDLDLVQPIPLIHFDFIRKFIQPRFDLPWRSEREISAVESMLFRKYKESIKHQPQ
jgi:hypothetical protein